MNMSSIIKLLREGGVDILLNAIFIFIIYKFLMKKLNQTQCIFTPEGKNLTKKVDELAIHIQYIKDMLRDVLDSVGVRYKGKDDD